MSKGTTWAFPVEITPGCLTVFGMSEHLKQGDFTLVGILRSAYANGFTGKGVGHPIDLLVEGTNTPSALVDGGDLAYPVVLNFTRVWLNAAHRAPLRTPQRGAF